MTKQAKANQSERIKTDISDFVKAYNCDEAILQKIKYILDLMLKKHDSILFAKFALYYPEPELYPADNKLLDKWVEKLSARLKANKRYYSIFWVRSKDFYRENPTYSLILLVDCYFTTHIDPLKSLARHFWASTLGLEWKTKSIFDYCEGKEEQNNFLINISDPNVDMTYFTSFDCAAQMSKLIAKDAPPETECYGFISNSIQLDKGSKEPAKVEAS